MIASTFETEFGTKYDDFGTVSEKPSGLSVSVTHRPPAALAMEQTASATATTEKASFPPVCTRTE